MECIPPLTLSGRRSLLHRSISLSHINISYLWKSMDHFLYNKDLRQERGNRSSIRFLKNYMVENLPFLIFLVFLVLFYYFCVEVFVQLLLCYNNPCCGMISRVWGNHQNIFDFLLREEDEVVKLVLFLINIFLLVVAVITFLGILLASSHSESGGPFLLSLLY